MGIMKKLGLIVVRCQKCEFTTSRPELESEHQIMHSLEEFQCKSETKKVLKIISDEFIMNGDEAIDVFNQILEVMEDPARFELIECFKVENGT